MPFAYITRINKKISLYLGILKIYIFFKYCLKLKELPFCGGWAKKIQVFR